MKKSTWILLGVVLVALLGAVWMRGKLGAVSEELTRRLLGDVDLATLEAVEIVSGDQTVRVELLYGSWGVSQMDGYRADMSRLRRLVQHLDEAEPGQVMEEAAGDLAEYGLAADGDEAPMLIRLTHAGGVTTVALGKSRTPGGASRGWGMWPGRFARVDEGAVVLLKDDVPHVEADPDLWWEQNLFELEPRDIREIRLTRADSDFMLRQDEEGEFELADAAEGESVVRGRARRLFDTLRSWRADKLLAGEDWDAEAEGVFRVEVRMDDDTLIFEVGPTPEDEPGGRPVRFVAATETDLEGRVFRVPAYRVDPLVAERADVIRVLPPVPQSPVEEPEAAEGEAEAAEAEAEEEAAEPETEAGVEEPEEAGEAEDQAD